MSQANVDSVIISNGEDFFEISAEDLVDALNDGFYLPRDRGLTIVSNGEDVFEIPVEDVAEALQDGFRDLIENPDGSLPSQPAVGSGSVSDGSAEKQSVVADSPVDDAKVGDQRVDEKPVGDAPTRVDKFELSETNASAVSTDDETPNTDDVAAAALPDAVAESGSDLGEVAVEESDDAEAERRRQLEESLETAQGFEKLKLFVLLHAPTKRDVNRFMRSYGASTLLHVILVAILWNIVYATPDKSDVHVISSVLNDAR